MICRMMIPRPARYGVVAAAWWGLYALLWRGGWAPWYLDLMFLSFVPPLLLWRERPLPLLSALGIILAVATRSLGSRHDMALLNALFIACVLAGGGRWTEERAAALPPRISGPLNPRRLAATLAVFLFLAFHGAKPTWLMVRPDLRRDILTKISPGFPVAPPAKLSPPAARLRGHVQALSGTMGERSVYFPGNQNIARDYVANRLADAGYRPRFQEYPQTRKSDFQRREPFYNVEAVLDAPPGGEPEAWILGAHYDSAPGTPGADDNASGVAVLLEAARLLKVERPRREIRIVAFGTEEPPSFGTRDMGSWVYALGLKDAGTPVFAMLNLEMLGYYNPRPKSQLFPPFLHLIYPDQADFIGLVGNLSSAGLAARVRGLWRREAKIPVETTILPSAFSTLALSDQLNFWSLGYRAVMFSDTSYFRYPHYHQDSDTDEKLDYERMAAVTRGVVRVLADL